MSPARDNLDEVIEGVLEALAQVSADEAASFCLAHIEGLEAAKAAALVALVVGALPTDAWVRALRGGAIGWPAAAREALLSGLRALPRGRLRVEGLCRVAAWLPEAELREAFEGVLDGTYPSTDWVDGKPFSNRMIHRRFLSVVPDDWKEELVSCRVRSADTCPASQAEAIVRDEIDHWPEGALRRHWAAIHERPAGRRGVLLEYYGLASRLPGDLRAEALRTIRACPSESTRRFHLIEFVDDLDDAERLDVVRHPWRESLGPSCVADHLRHASRHLPRVPYDEVRAWLGRAKGVDDVFWRTSALVCLAPFLEGDDRDEVAACFVRLVREQGDWQGVRWAPEILSPEALAALLVEAARDESTFFEAAPRLLAHLASRPPEVQALCLEPLFARFQALGPAERVALAYGVSRWLAARSGGAFAERVASALVANPGLLPAADGAA